MPITPLVIKNTKGIDPKGLKVWNKYTEATSLIKSIAASAASGDGDGNTSKIISGIPTPWARAIIFRYAIDAIDDGLAPGLKDFYDKIKVEWRALIAFIALHSNDIKVEKIDLTGDVNEPSDFKARLGSMLFEEESLWSNPNNAGLANNDPYIQLIKYKIDKNKYITVGATSPHTVVFTPPRVRSDKQDLTTKFIKGGSWVEPTKCELTGKELQTIYDSVTYIKEHLSHYKKLLDSANILRLNFNSLDIALKNYQADLKSYTNKDNNTNGKNIKRNNLFNAPKKFFQAPFDILFNAEAKLYEKKGTFHKNIQGAPAFKVEEFLAPSKKAVEIIFKSNEGETVEKNTAHLLKVIDEDIESGVRYFAIPLSEKGIIYFQDNLGDLLGETTNTNHRLNAEIENGQSGKRLKVYLRIYFSTDNPTDKNETDFTIIDRIYQLSSDTSLHNERIIVWPNFIANDWKKYYLYNELPHNLEKSEVKAFPLIGEVYDNKNVVLQQSKPSQLKYIHLKNSKDEGTTIDGVKIPVKHPVNASGSILKYEIYESEFPFIGIELRVGKVTQENAGYLITKNFANTANPGELKLEFKDGDALQKAIVGIDFGSNNTCVSYYSLDKTSQKLITFHNRRRFFMGSERSENDLNMVSNAMELFFFNKTKTIGQLKSMLVAHDKTRLANKIDGIKKEVRGGFPVMEKNLPISTNKMKDTEFHYDLEVNRNAIDSIHNMKWAPDTTLNKYKFSFLKTLWLQINAELYSEEHRPTILRWAYPAAMGNTLKNIYRIMWEEVINEIKPIEKQDICKVASLTEGMAVATYAIQSPAAAEAPGGRLSVGTGTMGIGYDVGGSTTDILILIKKNGENSPKLAKQSSILLAAQYLSKAIKKSSRIQDELKNFLKAENIKIHGIDEMNNDTAPYFLNAVFDRLDALQLQRLYKYFYENKEKGLFAIVSYVSGLILYYTGQLAARVILEENITIDFVTKGVYGKGGNIFNWITTVMPEDSKEYYQNCFFAGLGKTVELDKKIEELKIDSDVLETSNNTDLSDLKKELEGAEEIYEIDLDNISLKQQIEDLKVKIADFEKVSNPSENIDISSLEIKKEDFEKKLKVWIKNAATVTDANHRINELEKEIEDINAILKVANQKGNKESQLKGLERIQKLIINSEVEYQTNFRENKSEVSFGLSSAEQIKKVTSSEEIPEIVGEEGYQFDKRPLSFTDTITTEHLKEFGGRLEYPDNFIKLEEFAEIYCNFVSKNDLLDVSVIREAVKGLSRAHFQSYVESLPQFATARSSIEFDFKTPMIILEGMCLLDNVILKECFKD